MVAQPTCLPFTLRSGLIQPPNALKSNGTLLPRPARYLLTPAVNGRGFGKSPSFWNLNRVSSMCTIPCIPELRELVTGDGPPLERV